MILDTFTPNTPGWHEARRWRVGGSEIGPICGWSHYATVTRDSLMADKLSGRATDETPDMRRGNLLEPVILRWLEERHNLHLDPTASAATWVHDDDDRLLVNPDGLCQTDDGLVLLEAKTTSDRCKERSWGRAGTDLAPLAFQAQVVWGMGITGATTAHLGVLHGATNGRPDLAFATYTIPFQQRLFDFMRRKAEAFLAELDIIRRGK
ncbi:YqaJ viral recombinase family protein [Aestuariimicrobium sp. p3-SID1156]|uniref:YqaJ viral recombinase family protein n=1 Tax=Aestuariimicrobium sp. p3-SID1156 TaxID=2916038 RepID=UPI00223A9631|nr:YqaJ viral recombinase family protein [Aestuariimicrobium sp. p3-SID1156]MCT1459903.1 YqaJ viral recombinase family protein [Aestuariimicrobium sp. p3-SID1156]